MGDEGGGDGRKRDGFLAVIPDWAKFAGAVVAGTISALLWMQSNFVSRIEFAAHAIQGDRDISRMAEMQEHYAMAERRTAENLAEIRNDVSWLRSYLDMSRPPPRNNGNKKEATQ